MRLLGILCDRSARPGAHVAGLPVIGPVEEVFGMVHRGEVDQVVVAMPWAAEARALALLQRLGDHPVDVRLAPELVSYHLPPRGRTELGGVELVHLLDRPVSGWAGVLKAMEDYAFAALALAIAAVPMALIALAVRLDSPGPIFFRQRRTGFNNRDFHVLKFRTMYEPATDHGVDEIGRAHV